MARNSPLTFQGFHSTFQKVKRMENFRKQKSHNDNDDDDDDDRHRLALSHFIYLATKTNRDKQFV